MRCAAWRRPLCTLPAAVSMPFFILGLMLPVYGKQIGASVVEIGLFFSAFSLVTVLLRPLVGWGLDHAAVARAALSTGQAIGVQATCEHP